MVLLAGADRKITGLEYIVWKGKTTSNIIFGEKGCHEWKARGIYWKGLVFPTLFPTTFPTNTKWGVWPGEFDKLQKAFKIFEELPTR